MLLSWCTHCLWRNTSSAPCVGSLYLIGKKKGLERFDPWLLPSSFLCIVTAKSKTVTLFHTGSLTIWNTKYPYSKVNHNMHIHTLPCAPCLFWRFRDHCSVSGMSEWSMDFQNLYLYKNKDKKKLILSLNELVKGRMEGYHVQNAA